MKRSLPKIDFLQCRILTLTSSFFDNFKMKEARNLGLVAIEASFQELSRKQIVKFG